MLHRFPKNYKHPDMPFYAIKWAVFDAPGPVSARDVCWLEYGDIKLDDQGREFGFGVVSFLARSLAISCTGTQSTYLFVGYEGTLRNPAVKCEWTLSNPTVGF